MLQKIADLEKIARILEPDSSQRKEWNEKVLEYTDGFLNKINDLNAYNEEDGKGRGILDFPINWQQKLKEHVS